MKDLGGGGIKLRVFFLSSMVFLASSKKMGEVEKKTLKFFFHENSAIKCLWVLPHAFGIMRR